MKIGDTVVAEVIAKCSFCKVAISSTEGMQTVCRGFSQV